MKIRLLSGFLILTYDCNNRCRWCYASPSGFKKDMMDFEKIKEYLKLMKSLGVEALGLLGGEPTLYPRLFEAIKSAKNLGFSVTLYTNGRKLCDPNFVRRLKMAGLDFVNFSVQSGSKYSKKHDEIVNVRGAWAETKQGIENCKKSGLKINIQTVITHADFKIYKEIIDEFQYANLFIYYRQIPPITSACNFFRQKVFSNKKTKELYKRIYLYAQEKTVRTYFFSRMPLCWWDEADPVEKEIHGNVVSHCHIINGSFLSIDVDGKILPCPQYVGLPTMNLVKANKVISKEEFFRIFNNGIPEKVRTNLKYVPDKRCLKCKYFGKRCTGGCPLVKFDIGPYAPNLKPRAHSYLYN